VIENELREYMAHRWDGPWELLATAVGVPQSVERTELALGAAEIVGSAPTSSSSPSVLDDRIQALAAFEPRRLVELVGQWRPLESLASGEPSEWEVDLWTFAWIGALRHVPWTVLPEHVPLATPLPIRREIATLRPNTSVTSQDELTRRANLPETTYDDLRSMGQPANHQEPITAADLQNLLAPESSLGLERLRVAIGDRYELSGDAATFVAELLERDWFENDRPSWINGGRLLLMELFSRHCVDESLYRRMAASLVPRVERDGPREWARVAYLLARTSWTNP